MRFNSHGLAPKSAADFAFLLTSFHFRKDESPNLGVPAPPWLHFYLDHPCAVGIAVYAITDLTVVRVQSGRSKEPGSLKGGRTTGADTAVDGYSALSTLRPGFLDECVKHL